MKTWTIIRLLQEARQYFERCGILSARLDAEILLAHVLNKDRIRLYIDFEQPVLAEELSRFREMVKRRAQREPVAYITGHKEFWSLRLRVDRSVLIPRPETEILVDAALNLLRAQEQCNRQLRVLDLGTGSGAIALALAKETEHTAIVAVDRSLAALHVARYNTCAYDFGKRVHLVCGDGVQPFGRNETFDLIVANPPYIGADALESLEPDIINYEPLEALAGGPDGLDFYRTWIPRLPGMLRPHGWVVLECGHEQTRNIAAFCTTSGDYTNIKIIKDYAHIDRVIMAQKC